MKTDWLSPSESLASRSKGGHKIPVSRLVPAVVLIVLVFAAVTGFVFTKQVVSDQEQRLLDERGDEVVALLSNSIDSIDSSLRVLGAVASSSNATATPVFTASTQTLLKG